MALITFIKRGMKKINIRYIILIFFCIILLIWLMNRLFFMENYFGMSESGSKDKRTNLNLPENKNQNKDEIDSSINKKTHSRQIPLIFIGGVPRSGTTLMRVMLDSHPDVKCGEETRIIPRIVSMRDMWKKNKLENERLINAGMTDELIDSAVSAFILEIITNYGKSIEHMCNKDPLVLRYTTYMKTLFPNAKFILMIRDGRASVHSIITRKVTITGFNLNSYRECLTKWNIMIEQMYAVCNEVGPKSCLPVYYEQLVLHPEKTMKIVLKFLNITWNDAVLNHEKFIGKKISISKNERSSDQVIKPINLGAFNSWVGKIPADVVNQMEKIAPMLRHLGYDPNGNPPNYGDADQKIKENTLKVQANIEYWKNLAKNYSIHEKYFV